MSNKKYLSLLRYSIQRMLFFVPTLIIITLLAFGLTKMAPGDPVRKTSNNLVNSSASLTATKTEYLRDAKRLNLHLPNFYFDIRPQSYPDTLYRIVKKLERETQEKLLAQYGNWERISPYYNSISALERELLDMPDSIAPSLVIKIKSDLVDLYASYRPDKISTLLSKMEVNMSKDSALLAAFLASFSILKGQYEAIAEYESPWKNWIPNFNWHGINNQYHLWLMGLLKGDFGKSYNDFRPVGAIILPALSWTLTLFVVTLFLAFLLAIPLGVYSAIYRNSRLDRWMSLITFLLFSLPVFWVGTALLVFFTTPEYGMNWFDGMWQTDLANDAPFWSRFMETSNHLVLPIVCMVYPSLAFLSRQMRGSMVEVLDQQYILTARAKGLPPHQVHWRHAFRNALFPIITIIGSIFPAAITGSVVIEYIYQIPGMGWVTIEAIQSQDWPVVFAVLMFGAILTLIGLLVADILYAIADPRVTYE